MTDTDAAVTRLALELVEQALIAGRARIEVRDEWCCLACDHMSPLGSHPCHACGNRRHALRTMRLLVADRPPDRPALDHRRIHAVGRRSPRHLRNIADNIPTTLILSRTRAHGIDLEPLGLPAGMMLDPRAGVHLTALAAARRADTDQVIMTITANAAANVAGYGEPFLCRNEPELLYTLHGRLPYDEIDHLDGDCQRLGVSAESRRRFEVCFLPLWSWRDKSGTPAKQLSSLLKYYRRADLLAAASDNAMSDTPDAQVALYVRHGNPCWIGDKRLLATALAHGQT